MDGSLWAWGENEHGALGDGTTDDHWSPHQVGSEYDWIDLEAGGHHTVAIKSDETLWAWGYNVYGQLGDGTTGEKHSPVPITVDSNNQPFNNIIATAAGDLHTLALKSDGHSGLGRKWRWAVRLRRHY